MVDSRGSTVTKLLVLQACCNTPLVIHSAVHITRNLASHICPCWLLLLLLQGCLA